MGMSIQSVFGRALGFLTSGFLICVCTNPVLADTSIKHRLEMGHGRFVRAIAFSPDAEMIAVACGQDDDPGEIRLYSVDDGIILATLKGHEKAINCLAFTPDGSVLVSGGSDNKCVVWNTASRKATGELTGPTDLIVGLSISPDGKQVATSSYDKTIIFWDLGSRNKIATLEGHKEIIGRLVHSPNGKLLAGGSGEGTIRIWDVGTKKELAQWKGHDGGVGVAFTPDGRRLATYSGDGSLKLWDTRFWLEAGKWLMGRDECISLAIPPNGKQLAVGSCNGEVVFYNISRQANPYSMTKLKGNILATRVGFRVHDCGITSLAFSFDGKMLASGSLDGTVKILMNPPK
jgi:WD40 repeat protein